MSTSTDKDTNALEKLLQSCSSIRKRARSTQALSLAYKKRILPEDGSNDTQQQIEEEEQTGQFLDQNIKEYQRRIAELQRYRRNTTIKSAAPRQQKILVHSKLMDECLRWYQEKLLLSRMTMAKPAQHVASTVDFNQNSQQQRTNNQTILIQQSIHCRNRTAKTTLEVQRKLDAARKEMLLVVEEGRKLKEKNQEAWDELQHTREKPLSSSLAKPEADEALRRLVAETFLLNRVVAELIAGSTNLDWYSDRRIQETSTQLE